MTLRKENIQTRNRKLNTRPKNVDIEKFDSSPTSSVDDQNYENNLTYLQNNSTPHLNYQSGTPPQPMSHHDQNIFVNQSQYQNQIYGSNSFGNFFCI